MSEGQEFETRRCTKYVFTNGNEECGSCIQHLTFFFSIVRLVLPQLTLLALLRFRISSGFLLKKYHVIK